MLRRVGVGWHCGEELPCAFCFRLPGCACRRDRYRAPGREGVQPDEGEGGERVSEFPAGRRESFREGDPLPLIQALNLASGRYDDRHHFTASQDGPSQCAALLTGCLPLERCIAVNAFP